MDWVLQGCIYYKNTAMTKELLLLAGIKITTTNFSPVQYPLLCWYYKLLKLVGNHRVTGICANYILVLRLKCHMPYTICCTSYTIHCVTHLIPYQWNAVQVQMAVRFNWSSLRLAPIRYYYSCSIKKYLNRFQCNGRWAIMDVSLQLYACY